MTYVLMLVAKYAIPSMLDYAARGCDEQSNRLIARAYLLRDIARTIRG